MITKTSAPFSGVKPFVIMERASSRLGGTSAVPYCARRTAVSASTWAGIAVDSPGVFLRGGGRGAGYLE